MLYYVSVPSSSHHTTERQTFFLASSPAMEECVVNGPINSVQRKPPGKRSLLKRCYSAKLFIIEPAVFLYMLGASALVILSEQYYFKTYGLRILRNTPYSSVVNGSACVTSYVLAVFTGSNDSYKQVQANSNHLVLYVLLVNKLTSIAVTTLFIAPLTDRVGRKIGLILPGVGAVLQGLLGIFVIKYKMNPYYFILGGFLAGLFGDMTSILAASFAYVADVSGVRWRSLRIGVIEGFMAVGSAVGQLSVGYWLEKINCYFIPPMILYVAANAAIIIYVAVFVPSGLPGGKRKEAVNSKKESVVSTYAEGARLYCGGLSLRTTWKLYVVTLVTNVAILNISGSGILSVFYLMSPPLNFNSSQIGIYQFVRSLTQGLSNLAITGLLVAINVSDTWMMLMAFLVGGSCEVLMGFSKYAWQIYTGT